ncbi:hypothetical protein [Flectobacillus rivi]|uniref:RNA polymerase alpha subunit C-terminal domain-containing protein n=1 Tax=Flectobacillus rivi TaxID=2984209 RepID=A0ABT6Z7L7_9BACT|nr:hypothetical protein [Flectobacillus rivi]MDI9877118.1 hypothetical protein [Flectobacillus rivi]
MPTISHSEYLNALRIIKEYEEQKLNAGNFLETLSASKNLKRFLQDHNVVSFDQLVELFQNGTMNSWSGFGKKLLLEIDELIQKSTALQ